MPWGSPIGTGKGLLNPYALKTIRERLPEITLIVDARIGKPSHTAQAMELGYDGVLLNTAVALATDPVTMASAFQYAVMAGRIASWSNCCGIKTALPCKLPVKTTTRRFDGTTKIYCPL